jgi:hypothetical protein
MSNFAFRAFVAGCFVLSWLSERTYPRRRALIALASLKALLEK